MSYLTYPPGPHGRETVDLRSHNDPNDPVILELKLRTCTIILEFTKVVKFTFLDATNFEGGGVYTIVHNVPGGKLYVGSAKAFKKRFLEHHRNLRTSKHVNRKLQSAYKKYGPDAFLLIVLETVPLPSDNVPTEDKWIKRLRAYEEGYNLTPTAGSSLGVKHSPETCEKMAAAHRGRKRSPETREKMAAAKRGRKPSPETRSKRWQQPTEAGSAHPRREKRWQQPNRGKKRSPETREKIGSSQPRQETLTRDARKDGGSQPRQETLTRDARKDGSSQTRQEALTRDNRKESSDKSRQPPIRSLHHLPTHPPSKQRRRHRCIANPVTAAAGSIGRAMAAMILM